jgi:hypothetical protein
MGTTTTIAKDMEKVIDKAELLPSSSGKAVGGLKQVIVKEGKENAFESLLRELASKVRKHDKGRNYYDLYKLQQPRTFI